MKTSPVAAALSLLFALSGFGQESASPKTLELGDALRLALERNPQLHAAQFAVHAAGGRLLQSGTIPNPTLSAEVEDFGGSGDLRGLEASSTTVAFEQTIELGGKRTARRNVATSEKRLAEWERDALRLDVIKETTERFVDILAAQEELVLSQEAWQTAENIYRTVSSRVTAGKDSPVEEAKARAELALAKLSAERAKSRLTVSRRALSAMWVDGVPAFESVRGDLAEVAENIPAVALLHEAVTRSPGWARWGDEIQALEWTVEAERRNRIPDLTLGAGIRQSQVDNGHAFVASVGVELPIFDRRRGSLLAAQADLGRKNAERNAAHTALRTELAAAHELLVTMRTEAIAIAKEALPAAEQAFAAAQASYAGGKTGYLDVQDARRSVIEMRRRRIEALAGYHRTVAHVERLAGTRLGEIEQK